jgi:hypothetical protein
MSGHAGAARLLPLHVIDQPGGAVIRCLCGAELATLRRATTNLRGMSAAARLPHLSPDITAAGLAIMVAHAKQCRPGLARLSLAAGSGRAERASAATGIG